MATYKVGDIVKLSTPAWGKYVGEVKAINASFDTDSSMFLVCVGLDHKSVLVFGRELKLATNKEALAWRLTK